MEYLKSLDLPELECLRSKLYDRQMKLIDDCREPLGINAYSIPYDMLSDENKKCVDVFDKVNEEINNRVNIHIEKISNESED